MAAIHLNEIYSSRVKDGLPNISCGSLIRWRVKTIRARDMQIMKAYPARVDYTQPRKPRRKPSREVQKKLNDRNCTEQFRLLLMTNFSKEDLFATLTFKQEPSDKAKAAEKLKYFLSKLRKKSAGKIKYLGVIETKNTDCEAVRCHIHIVFSGVDYGVIKKNWKYGHARIRKMEDARNTAGYLSKAFAHMPAGEHHYTRSRNLKNPDIETKTLDVRDLADAQELEAIITCPKEYAAVFYPDYELTEEPEIWRSSYMPGYYVKIEMIRGDHSDKTTAKISSFHTHQANEMLGFHKSSAQRQTKCPRNSS